MAASRSVAITYVPADCGSVIPGKSKAPKAFQDVDIAKQLRDSGFESVSEHNSLESPAKYKITTSFPPGSVRNEDANIAVCESVHRTIAQTLKPPSTSSTLQSPFQLILGGECGMLPGVLSAFWQHQTAQRIGLIYIDADTDLASPTDPTTTGIFAGMNMTHLLLNPGSLPRMKQFSRPDGSPVCDASNTVLFGTNMALATNTREHLGFLFDGGFRVVSSAAVVREPERRARDALRWLVEDAACDVVLVHLDVDAIDPRGFPLANLPNYTGVGFDEMMRALGVLLGSEKVGGLVVAEVNPDHDPELEMTGRLTREIVRMLGARGEKGGE